MQGSAHNRSEAVDGLLLLNKPAGLTSNQALQRVRRLLNAKKAGHTGSLDPAATGMLPLCFGQATKVCSYLLNADKTYRVTARLGVSTTTGDADGEAVARADVADLSAEQWQSLLAGFLGESMQIPPMYSALRKNGKRLYELARRGVTVPREPRPIRIDDIELREIAGSRLVFQVRCSKGTYVRALVEDLAAAAGTVAHTDRLHREGVGDFAAEDMLDLNAMETVAADGAFALRARLMPADTALARMSAVTLAAVNEVKFSMGQRVSLGDFATAGLVRVYGSKDVFLGVGELTEGGRLVPRRVFVSAENGQVEI